jgi:DHA1 family multidrug/chloramphenicol efflux transport protein-like MFS transporter
MAGSPLSRFILFSTPVAKGTASALMSMILMSVQALGIQIANALYATHNNLILGLYCVLVSCLYMLVMAAAFWLNQKKA